MNRFDEVDSSESDSEVQRIEAARLAILQSIEFSNDSPEQDSSESDSAVTKLGSSSSTSVVGLSAAAAATKAPQQRAAHVTFDPHGSKYYCIILFSNSIV
jgi:hypothetical protein